MKNQNSALQSATVSVLKTFQRFSVAKLKARGRCAASNASTLLTLLTPLTLLTLLTLQLLNASRASAQTNQVPNLIPNEDTTFFQSVAGYLTTVNTNYSFAGNVLEVSAGAGQSGPILANYVSAQYDLSKSATFTRWDLAAQMRNAGIAGVIQTAEIGGGYAVIESGDTKVQLGLLGGWDFQKSAGLFEPEVVLRKKATKNTYFETGISLPIWTAGPLNKTPAFFIGTGFTY